jgi:tetratricopeptide (TPR) repeat protein
MPTDNRRLVYGLCNQMAIQVGHRLNQAGLKRSEEEIGLLEAARACERLAEIYYFDNNKTATIYASLRTLNLAERSGLTPELARAYANMSLAAGILPSPTLAKVYEKRANTTTRKVDSLSSVARVLLASGVYDLGMGRWAKFQDELGNALAIADGIGDRHRWEECTALQLFAARCQGNFAAATWLCSDLLASARRSGNSQSQISALHGQATGLLLIGQGEAALELLDEAKRLLNNYPGRVEAIKIDSLLALAHLRQGSLETAYKFAESAAALTFRSAPTAVQLLESYSSLAEVYWQLWQCAIDNGDAKQVELATKFGQSCQAFQRYARVFPIGKARAQLWQGIFWQFRGKKAVADKSWRKALVTAEKLALPYDTALVQLELARYSGATGRHYLEKAIQSFEKTGASYDLTRARNLKAGLISNNLIEQKIHL